MEYNHLNLVFFSTTYTTRKTLHNITEGIGAENITEYDITCGQVNPVTFGRNELTLFGVPVYAGRVPHIAAESLRRFTSNGSPAIVVCVYGNRDFDDALLELHDIVTDNGFKVIAAGAFVAQHSIFPQTAHNRPDEKDRIKARNFGLEVLRKLQSTEDINALPDLTIKGNRPYRKAGRVPLTPHTDRRCNACGKCVRLCPVQAISKENPRRTDKNKCIACARCIAICPKRSRHFGGILYFLASRKFNKAYTERKEPYTVC